MAEEMESRLNRIMERRRFGMRPGLETMRAVLAELGNPQDALRCVHVAGTNGKGATCAILDAVLRAAGLRVARYTSPHLVRVNERFFLDGAPASDAALADVGARVLDVVERLARDRGLGVTFFETPTAMAFLLFAEAKVDVVVLETGLGGRLDATNVVASPLVSVITRIGLDHCDWLGTTHAAIAEEKAGIVKPGRPVVCGAMPLAAKETVARFASLNGCAFTAADEHVCLGRLDPLTLTTAARRLPPVSFALPGVFQAENAMTALAALDVLARDCGLAVPDHAVVTGLEGVVWPGRCQRVDRDGVTFVVDGAHNPDGAVALRDAVRRLGLAGPVGLVAGFCGDKDVLAHLRIMSAVATHGWATPIRNARSLEPAATAERMLMAGFTSAEPCGSLAEALAHARDWARANGGSIVACGSLFLAGEVLVELGAFPWDVRAPDANELTLR